MTKLLPLLQLLLPVAFITSGLSPVHAQANDMFPTRAAAEKRAKDLNCSGAFSMAGEWMPCMSIEAYEKAVKKESK